MYWLCNLSGLAIYCWIMDIQLTRFGNLFINIICYKMYIILPFCGRYVLFLYSCRCIRESTKHLITSIKLMALEAFTEDS